MQTEKKQKHHFDPYVKIEILESERRLEKQIHELEIKMLNGFADLRKDMTNIFTQLKKEMRFNFYTLYGLIAFFFSVVPNWPSIRAWFF